MPLEEIKRQAKYLANENRLGEPEITKIFWFPNEHEVRLVEVMPNIPINEDEQIHAYFFRPAPLHNLPAPSGVALIRPDEVGKLKTPDGWGDWDSAVELDAESE